MYVSLCVSFRRINFPGDTLDDDDCIFSCSNHQLTAQKICFRFPIEPFDFVLIQCPLTPCTPINPIDQMIRCWCGCKDKENLLIMKVIEKSIVANSSDLTFTFGTDNDYCEINGPKNNIRRNFPFKQKQIDQIIESFQGIDY